MGHLTRGRTNRPERIRAAGRAAGTVRRGALSACVLCCAPVHADGASDDFVEANLLGIFYHELGHALIDIEALPVFGQEEDAADVLSIFLIDALFDDRIAEALARDAALGFRAEALVRADAGDGPAWWDEHGPDEQRFYNAACLFYGADRDGRARFADDMGLPPERAENCDLEFDRASDSWGALLDELTARTVGEPIRLSAEDGSITASVLRPEIDALNDELRLSAPLEVVVEPCGEANAFYDPATRTVTMCLEFEDHLFELLERL